MKLKTRQETYTVVSFKDIETLIDRFYKVKKIRSYPGGPLRGYSAVATEFWSNDETHCYTVEPLQPRGQFEKDEIRKLKEGKYVTYILSDLLNDMCFHEVIPAGEYMIEVSW